MFLLIIWAFVWDTIHSAFSTTVDAIGKNLFGVRWRGAIVNVLIAL